MHRFKKKKERNSVQAACSHRHKNTAHLQTWVGRRFLVKNEDVLLTNTEFYIIGIDLISVENKSSINS